MSAPNSAGYYVVTDPQQEKDGYYRVSKTANMSNTLTQLNCARANKDFRIVKFYPVSDLKKAEEFIKSALKKKYIPNSTEWVKIDDQAGLSKVLSTLETLIDIVNNAD